MGMSDLNERLNQLEQGALNFLFPRRCPFCNQHIGNKELICAGPFWTSSSRAAWAACPASAA